MEYRGSKSYTLCLRGARYRQRDALTALPLPAWRLNLSLFGRRGLKLGRCFFRPPASAEIASGHLLSSWRHL